MLNLKLLFLGHEDVTVAAGNFQDTLKLILKAGPDYVVTWWANGVGSVRSFSSFNSEPPFGYQISKLNT